MKRKTSIGSHSIQMVAALYAVRQAQFGPTDILRRLQGDAVAAFGFGPSECAYQIIASGPHWRLRDYGSRNASASLLIVAASIKRPYIWDLAPSTSAIRYCLQPQLHAHLLEWMPASRDTSNNGIDESALAISDCVAKISANSSGLKPFVIGHSLGGTLATIYGALASETIRGFVLLAAPLCFQPEESQFRDTLVVLLGSVRPFGCGAISGLASFAYERDGVSQHLHLVEADRRSLEYLRRSKGMLFEGKSQFDGAILGRVVSASFSATTAHAEIFEGYPNAIICKGLTFGRSDTSLK